MYVCGNCICVWKLQYEEGQRIVVSTLESNDSDPLVAAGSVTSTGSMTIPEVLFH